MGHAIHRSDLLRGDLGGRNAPVRPPWATPDFTERCTACGDCLTACPEAVIRAGRARLPVLDFSRGGCSLCGACRDACPDGVLDAARPWRARVMLEPDCLAQRGVVCRTCGDFCDVAAIRFRLQPGGCAIPEFDMDRCTGCGACAAPCPTGAIRILNRPVPALREVGT